MTDDFRRSAFSDAAFGGNAAQIDRFAGFEEAKRDASHTSLEPH